MSVSKRRVLPIDGGKPCPKCNRLMQRYKHIPEWKPAPGIIFFIWWDRCLPCGHIQNYAGAKRIAESVNV